MNEAIWYQTLIKPVWAPPAWLFGPVWTILYAIIFLTFGYVFWKYYQGIIPLLIILPFIFNLIFNFAFTPLQFGLQNNLLALLDIFLVLGTLVWAMLVIYPYFPLVVYANIPYLLWVSFATVLQINISYLNF